MAKYNSPLDAIIGLTEGTTKQWTKQRKAEERRAKDRARRASLRAAASFMQRPVNPFDHQDVDPTTGAWDSGRRLSDGQLAFLRRNGVDASHMTYKQGMQEMIKAKWRLDHKPPTQGQAAILGRFGLNPKLFNVKSASKAIDKIKEYGWKLTTEQRSELTPKEKNKAIQHLGQHALPL